MTETTSRPIRLGARTSPLARVQVDVVAALLADRGIESTFVGITTAGDVDQRQLTEIGGTGVFAGAVRDALRRGEIDVAVHSLKDLPTAPEDDLEVIAIPAREDPRDVLVGRRLDDLVGPVTIGTGAPRRAIQLLDWADRERAAGRRLELRIVPIRGNVDTRIELARGGSVDAVVLAAAGLRRLGYLDHGATDLEGRNADTVVRNLQAQILDHQVMLPAPGQGALALEIHLSLAEDMRDRIASLDDPVARAESQAERGFLGTLEAGCTSPVGARSIVKSVRGTSLDLTLAAVIGRTLLSNLSEPTKTGLVVGPSGVLRWEAHGSTDDPAHFGASQAIQVLSELRDPQGPRR